MPKAHEYSDGQTFFRDAIRWVLTQCDDVDPDWRAQIVSGDCYIKGLIDRTASASRANIGSIAEQLQTLEEECERRKVVCDAFDDKVRDYNRRKADYDAGPKNGPPPPVPRPPATWVEPSVPIAS